MRLALQMGRTLEELLNTISSDEISLWLAREQIEPLYDPWLGSALVAHTTARAAGNKCKVTDFYPRHKKTKKQSAAEQMSVLKAAAAAQRRK